MPLHDIRHSRFDESQYRHRQNGLARTLDRLTKIRFVRPTPRVRTPFASTATLYRFPSPIRVADSAKTFEDAINMKAVGRLGSKLILFGRIDQETLLVLELGPATRNASSPPFGGALRSSATTTTS